MQCCVVAISWRINTFGAGSGLRVILARLLSLGSIPSRSTKKQTEEIKMKFNSLFENISAVINPDQNVDENFKRVGNTTIFDRTVAPEKVELVLNLGHSKYTELMHQIFKDENLLPPGTKVFYGAKREQLRIKAPTTKALIRLIRLLEKEEILESAETQAQEKQLVEAKNYYSYYQLDQRIFTAVIDLMPENIDITSRTAFSEIEDEFDDLRQELISKDDVFDVELVAVKNLLVDNGIAEIEIEGKGPALLELLNNFFDERYRDLQDFQKAGLTKIGISKNSPLTKAETYVIVELKKLSSRNVVLIEEGGDKAAKRVLQEEFELNMRSKYQNLTFYPHRWSESRGWIELATTGPVNEILSLISEIKEENVTERDVQIYRP